MDAGNSDSWGNIEAALVDKELMHMVFGFLHLTHLASVSRVCRRWRVLSRADEVKRALVAGRVQSVCPNGLHTGLGCRNGFGLAGQLRVIWALEHETIVQIATVVHSYEYDKQHTLALTLDGKVYAFGDSTDGKLGLGDVTALKLPDVIYKPTLVSALRGEKIIKVAVAEAHSAALSSRGTVFTWGLTPNAGSAPAPAEVLCSGDGSSRPFIVDLWCGNNATLLLDDQGVLYSFGVTNCLGRPSSQDNGGRPQPVVFPDGVKIKSAAMGPDHGLAITTDGQVYSWGVKEGRLGVNEGRLGHSDRTNQTTPELISALAGKRAVQVACGTWHSLVLTEDNVLYSFGYSGFEQATGGLPRVVDLVKGLGTITAISAAHKRSVVLFESGRVVELVAEFPHLREIKPENWMVPRGICAGDLGSTFMVY